jgi:hypothetical protein
LAIELKDCLDIVTFFRNGSNITMSGLLPPSSKLSVLKSGLFSWGEITALTSTPSPTHIIPDTISVTYGVDVLDVPYQMLNRNMIQEDLLPLAPIIDPSSNTYEISGPWQTNISLDNDGNIILSEMGIPKSVEQDALTEAYLASSFNNISFQNGVTLFYKITETEPVLIVSEVYETQPSEEAWFYGLKIYEELGEIKILCSGLVCARGSAIRMVDINTFSVSTIDDFSYEVTMQKSAQNMAIYFENPLLSTSSVGVLDKYSRLAENTVTHNDFYVNLDNSTIGEVILTMYRNMHKRTSSCYIYVGAEYNSVHVIQAGLMRLSNPDYDYPLGTPYSSMLKSISITNPGNQVIKEGDKTYITQGGDPQIEILFESGLNYTKLDMVAELLVRTESVFQIVSLSTMDEDTLKITIPLSQELNPVYENIYVTPIAKVRGNENIHTNPVNPLEERLVKTISKTYYNVNESEDRIMTSWDYVIAYLLVKISYDIYGYEKGIFLNWDTEPVGNSFYRTKAVYKDGTESAYQIHNINTTGQTKKSVLFQGDEPHVSPTNDGKFFFVASGHMRDSSATTLTPDTTVIYDEKLSLTKQGGNVKKYIIEMCFKVNDLEIPLAEEYFYYDVIVDKNEDISTCSYDIPEQIFSLPVNEGKRALLYRDVGILRKPIASSNLVGYYDFQGYDENRFLNKIRHSQKAVSYNTNVNINNNGEFQNITQKYFNIPMRVNIPIQTPFRTTNVDLFNNMYMILKFKKTADISYIEVFKDYPVYNAHDAGVSIIPSILKIDQNNIVYKRNYDNTDWEYTTASLGASYSKIVPNGEGYYFIAFASNYYNVPGYRGIALHMQTDTPEGSSPPTDGGYFPSMIFKYLESEVESMTSLDLNIEFQNIALSNIFIYDNGKEDPIDPVALIRSTYLKKYHLQQRAFIDNDGFTNYGALPELIFPNNYDPLDLTTSALEIDTSIAPIEPFEADHEYYKYSNSFKYFNPYGKTKPFTDYDTDPNRFFYGKFENHCLAFKYHDLSPMMQKYYKMPVDLGHTYSENNVTNKPHHPYKIQYNNTTSEGKCYDFKIYMQQGTLNHLAVPVAYGEVNGVPNSVIGVGSATSYIQNTAEISDDGVIGVIHLLALEEVEALVESEILAPSDLDTYLTILENPSVYKMSEPKVKNGTLCVYGNEVIKIAKNSSIVGSEKLISLVNNDISRINPKFYTCSFYSINYQNTRTESSFSLPESHTILEPIRSVVEISQIVTSGQFENNLINPESDLFKPTSSNSTIEIVDDISNWSKFNPNRKYKPKKNDAVYLFEGDKNVYNCSYVGFIENLYTEIDTETTTINLIDRMTMLQEKEIRPMTYLYDTDMKTMIEQTIGDYIPCQIVLSKQCRDYVNLSSLPFIPLYYAGDYSTFKEFFDMLGNMGMRVWFDTLDRLIIDLDVLVKNNTDETKYLDLNSMHFLEDSFKVSLKENLIYNKIAIKYTSLIPTYSRKDFTHPSTGALIPCNNINSPDKVVITPADLLDSGEPQLIQHSSPISPLKTHINAPAYLTIETTDPADNINSLAKLIDYASPSLLTLIPTSYNQPSWYKGYLEYLAPKLPQVTQIQYSPNMLPIVYSYTGTYLLPSEKITLLVKTHLLDMMSHYYGTYKSPPYNLEYTDID